MLDDDILMQNPKRAFKALIREGSSALKLNIPLIVTFYRDGEVVIDSTTTSEEEIAVMEQVLAAMKARL